MTGIPYKHRGLGAKFGAKFSALVGEVVTILGFFVYMQNAEFSGGALFSLLFAIFFYGPVGVGLGLIGGLMGGWLGGEVGRQGYFVG